MPFCTQGKNVFSAVTGKLLFPPFPKYLAVFSTAILSPVQGCFHSLRNKEETKQFIFFFLNSHPPHIWDLPWKTNGKAESCRQCYKAGFSSSQPVQKNAHGSEMNPRKFAAIPSFTAWGFPFPSHLLQTEAASITTSSYTVGWDTVGRNWLSVKTQSGAFSALSPAVQLWGIFA